MKRLLTAVFCITLFFYVLSCSKDPVNSSSCSVPKAASDSTVLLAFAKKYGINPVADTSFLYYEIIKPGSGPTPLPTSTLYARYAGRLMDGSYFDSSATPIAFPLNNVIKGWQYGLPKIKPGGQIKLLVPAALAYGCAQVGSIPSLSPMYFNVYLDSLK